MDDLNKFRNDLSHKLEPAELVHYHAWKRDRSISLDQTWTL